MQLPEPCRAQLDVGWPIIAFHGGTSCGRQALQPPSPTLGAHCPRFSSPSVATALAAWLAKVQLGRRNRRFWTHTNASSRARVFQNAAKSNVAVAPGGLLVVCGPSGAGKSTMIKQLLEDQELRPHIALSVSHTTRRPRTGEQDGVHYNFTERSHMEQMIGEGLFLEYAEVHGNIYGTSFAAIDDARSGGRVCVLDIDLQGVKNLQQHFASSNSMPGCVARFVLVHPAGGLETLEARLRARSTDDEASIQRRLETARHELEDCQKCNWDCTIINEDGNLRSSTYALRGVLSELVSQQQKDAQNVRQTHSTSAVDAEPLEWPVVSGKNVFSEFSGLARALGSSCVDLGQGFPNFDPPDFVVRALQQELESQADGGPQTRHQYTRTAGQPLLVELLAERYSRHLGRALHPMKNVAVTVGATNGLYLAMQTAMQRAGPGAWEILTLEPFFELYRAQAEGLGATFRTVPMRFNENRHAFELDRDALSSALGPQTAVLIVNTPHNPSGKAFEEAELHAIADLVRSHPNLVVISDEVYKYMIFDPPAGSKPAGCDKPTGHVHFATLPGMWERTITVSSAGKTFGITGWQIGWVIGPSHWIQPIHSFMPNLQFCAPTLMQRALCTVFKDAAEPYGGAPSYYEWLRQDYTRRRQVMASALQDAGVKTVQSQGGFFMLGDIGGLCGSNGPLGDAWAASVRPDELLDWTFCRAMAAQLGIVALPVSPFFGPDAPDTVRTRFARFCFAKTDATLEEARQRLAKLRVVSV